MRFMVRRFAVALFPLAVFPLALLAQSNSVLNMSRDLVSKGIASSNMTPNSPTLNASPLLQAAVAYASANSIATVTADVGAYYFSTPAGSNQHVLLNGSANVTIDLQNSDLWFARSNTSAIACVNCNGVRMQNFTVDYQQLPFTQATITGVDPVNRALTFQTLPGWQSPADFNTPRAPDASDTIWMFVFRNGVPITQVGRLSGLRPVTGNTILIGDTADPWAAPANLAAIQPGDTLVWTDRSGPPAIDFVGGQKITVRNVSVYSSGQIALYFGRTAGATADRVQVIPRPGTSRLISSNADGIHVSFALANNTYTNNIVRRTCDDALAVSASWIAAIAQPPAGATVGVARRFTSPFPVGASVSFINPADASVAGTANIVSETPAPADQKFTDGEMVTLTLDKTISGLATGFGVVDADSAKRGSGTVIANNTVQEGVFSRGIWLAGIQGALVHDNFVQRTSNDGIFIQELTGKLEDTGPSSGITIRNNLVDGSIGYGGVSSGPIVNAASIHVVAESGDNGQVRTSPHSVILVTGNRVTNSPRTAIRLENVSGGQITGNVIQGFGLAPTANVYVIPPCCESMAQYIADFMQPVLTNDSLLTVSGNSSTDAGNLIATVSTAGYFPRVATGSFAVTFGTALAASTVVAAQPFPLSLGGLSVQITDSAGAVRAAQIYYVTPGAVAWLIPDGLAAGIATVTIGSHTGAAEIDSIAPGVYSASSSGQGVAAALAATYGAGGAVTPQTVFDCSAGAGMCVSVPMSLGASTDALIVSLYGTGFRTAVSTTATIGGLVSTVQYSGPVVGVPGLDQVNLIVPKNLAGSGEVPIVLTIDGQTANVVTINIK